jgi:hypothetical protein
MTDCDYKEPKGRGNKKSDKEKKNFELNGKNTKRGARHIEQIDRTNKLNKTK